MPLLESTFALQSIHLMSFSLHSIHLGGHYDPEKKKRRGDAEHFNFSTAWQAS